MSTATDEEKRKLYAGERLYSAAEVALERAALLREAAEAVGKVKQGLGAGGHGAGMYTEIQIGSPICDAVNDAILAIPTDQSALARHDAELLKNREYRDVLNYVEDYERMSRKEFSATHGEDIAAALARFETAAYERAKRDAAMECDKKDNFPSEIQRRILALEDRGREADER